MKKTILCKIKSITIPRIIPSKLFISWKFNNDSGKSDLYVADSAAIDVDFEIQLNWDQRKKNLLELALCACNKAQNKFRLGTDLFDIPLDEIEKHKKGVPPPSHTSIIDTEAGQFTIYSTFKLDNFNLPKSHEKRKITKAASFLMSPLEKFKELTTSLKPVPDSMNPPSYLWGDDGLIDLLQSFEFLQTTQEDIRFIKETESILPDKLKNTQVYAAILSKATSLMTSRDPIYITVDGKTGTAQQLEHNKRFSYLSVYICKFISDHLADENIFTLTEILQILFTQISSIICYPDVNHQQVFYLLTTVLFINQYLIIKSPQILNDISIYPILQTSIKSAMIQFLENLSKAFLNISKDERQILNFLSSLKEDFDLNNIGPSFTIPFMGFFLNYIDYTIVNQWIFDDGLESFTMSTLISQYSESSWKFCKSLQIIITESQKIISKKKFPDTICQGLKSSLGVYALQKLYNLGKIKAKEKDFASFKSIDNVSIENPYKIDAWCIENSIFASDQDFPKNLPNILK